MIKTIYHGSKDIIKVSVFGLGKNITIMVSVSIVPTALT